MEIDEEVVRLRVRLPKWVADRLRNLAEKEGRSVTKVVITILTEHLLTEVK